MAEFLKWSDIRIGTWNTNTFTWDDVSLVEELHQTSGGIPHVAFPIVNEYPQKKKKQLIKIILILKGKKYQEQKYKNNSNIKISLKDIQFLFENKEKIKPIVNIKIKE